MQGLGLIGAIIIGLLAGWIAQRSITRAHGLATNLVVGLAGSLIGAFLAQALGFAGAPWVGSLAASAAGAILILFLLSLTVSPAGSSRP